MATVAAKFGELEDLSPLASESSLIANQQSKYSSIPGNDFYFHRTGRQDFIFFIGQNPPSTACKVHEMGSLVLDIAEQFQCSRVYTTGAAVTTVHHTSKPMVWAATSREKLSTEVRAHPNTIVLTETEANLGDTRESFGLHQFLLEDARRRGLDCICLLGEIPFYVAEHPEVPYPRASKSIVETLGVVLGIDVNLSQFDEIAAPLEENITEWIKQLPPESKAITLEDQEKIIQEVDEFFRKG